MGSFNNSTHEKKDDDNAVHSTLIHSDVIRSSTQQTFEITIDEAVDKLSTGKFQYQILFAAGTCFMADAMEVMLLAFLGLVLKKEWQWDDDSAEIKVATITSCMFAGALAGTSILGPLGDKIGRRPTLFCAAFIISLFGFLTALCNNFFTLVVVRTIVGFGIGGITVPFDILAEFIPGEQRGRYLLLIEYFWTAGSLLVPVVGYVTLELFDSWRIFVAACAVPCLFSLIAGILLVPESPRWLILKGRNEEALDILRNAAVINGKNPQELFPQNCRLRDSHTENDDPGFRELFKPRWRRLTLLLFAIWMGTSITYYGTIMLCARVFDKQDNGGNENGDDKLFDYGALLISSFAEVAGTAVAIAFVDRIGRIRVLVGFFIGGGVSVLSVCLLANSSLRGALIFFSFVARACEMTVSSTLWILTVELFSTDIRSTGHAATNAMARIGGFASPYLVSGSLSYTSIGIFMITLHCLSAWCSSHLPETKGVEMGNARDTSRTRSVSSTIISDHNAYNSPGERIEEGTELM